MLLVYMRNYHLDLANSLQDNPQRHTDNLLRDFQDWPIPEYRQEHPILLGSCQIEVDYPGQMHSHQTAPILHS